MQAALLAAVVEEDKAKDDDAGEHGERASIVRIGAKNESLILVVTE